MNKTLKNSVFALAIILTSSIFMNCNHKKVTTNDDIKSEIEENKPYNNFQEVLVTRNPVVFISGYD